MPQYCISEINDDQIPQYFIKTLSPFRSSEITSYYIKNCNFGHIFIFDTNNTNFENLYAAALIVSKNK